MPINIKGTNVHVSDSMREYTEKRLSAIEKFIHDGARVVIDVELAKESNHHRKGDIWYAEINLQIDGTVFHASAEGEAIENAVDEVKDEILRELRKEKTRRTEKARQEEAKIKRELRGEE